MGSEADCTAIWKRRRIDGRALLETNEVIFRGEPGVTMALATLTEVVVTDGRLRLVGPEGSLTLELGDLAETWAEKIRRPKGLFEKLGVKSDQMVSVLGVDDAGFLRELDERAGEVHRDGVMPESDMVFLAADRVVDLVKLPSIERVMARDGAVWVVWVKGRRDLNEDHVRLAAKKVGLVDVKVVSFSDTHSALKLVIPLTKR